MATKQSTVVVLRNDLRVKDNEALIAAAQAGDVIPLFIWDEVGEEPWPPGGASRLWLRGALARLKQELRGVGSDLVIRRGQSGDVIARFLRETKASQVFLMEAYDPPGRSINRAISESATALRRGVRFFTGNVLISPDLIRTESGTPYKVFTPFWNAVRRKLNDYPLGTVTSMSTPLVPASDTSPEDVDDAYGAKWQTPLSRFWDARGYDPRALLRDFGRKNIKSYSHDRDLPAVNGTSLLSVFLRFGELSVREAWSKLSTVPGSEPFLRQLAWREFAYHLLFHFPHTTDSPLRREFAAYPWSTEVTDGFKTWTLGKTGYPLVDAGMRELWLTGYMHNRVRMAVASFLVKHLHISWTLGARWFWDTLVDADLANNTLGWQWVAGCGADAAPFFRIFNPITQGKKFDPDGVYLRRWVPELRDVDDKCLHQPGYGSVRPVVDLASEREVALKNYESIKARV